MLMDLIRREYKISYHVQIEASQYATLGSFNYLSPLLSKYGPGVCWG